MTQHFFHTVTTPFVLYPGLISRLYYFVRDDSLDCRSRFTLAQSRSVIVCRLEAVNLTQIEMSATMILLRGVN